MKKIIRKCSFFYLCLFGFALFSSCGTTKEVSDSKSVEIKIDDAEIIDYDNSVEDVESNEIDEIQDVSDTEDIDVGSDIDKADSYDDSKPVSKKQKRGFLTALLSLDKFVEYDYTTFYTSSVSGKLKKTDASTVIRSKDKWVGFGSQYMTAYYYITMDQKARQTLKNAVDQYFYDFENKKLIRKSNKTTNIYGSATIRADWGVLKKSVPYTGTGPAQFGYKFKDKSPYFTITINPVITDQRRAGDNTALEASARVVYYFTKAQAKALVDLLDEELLNEYFYSSEDISDEIDNY